MSFIYYTASSLDGFIADPEHSLAWLFAQDHAEPSEPSLRMDTLMERIGALLMGSSTYLWIRDHLSRDAQDWPYRLPTWVMTTRDLPGLAGADLRFASGDVAEVAEQIASITDGDVWVVGGGDLAGQLADRDLLDELVVSYAPVTLGSGAALLPRRLQLSMVTMERAGDFVCAHYRVAGSRPAADWNP